MEGVDTKSKTERSAPREKKIALEAHSLNESLIGLCKQAIVTSSPRRYIEKHRAGLLADDRDRFLFFLFPLSFFLVFLQRETLSK